MLTDALAQLVGGGLAVWICQFLKKTWKLEGTQMLWAAVLVSLVLAFAASFFTGGVGGILALIKDPTQILTGTGTVFATAQVIFRSLKDKLALQLPSDSA